MTNAQPLPVFLSANATFKANYPKYLRWSTLAAVILMSLLVWLMPKYEPTPYMLRDNAMEIIYIEEIKEVIVEREPLAAPQIVREIEPVGETEVEDIDITNTTNWTTWVPPVENDGHDAQDHFHASSANPRLLFQAKPEYSQVARMSGLEGLVIVKVLVGVGGQVERVQVIQGAHPILNQAAVKAAYQCRFEPGTQRSVPVQAWMAVPYLFRLH